MDIYSTFEELKQNEQEGADYRIRWRLGSSVTIHTPGENSRRIKLFAGQIDSAVIFSRYGESI